MLSTRFEFETVPAWTTIAGSRYGTETPRATAFELIQNLGLLNHHHADRLMSELAESYDDSQDILDIQDEAAEYLNDCLNMPSDCTVALDDGEWIVTPYVDEDLPRITDYPDKHIGEDDALVVNDHGNVTRIQWDASSREYRTLWELV